MRVLLYLVLVVGIIITGTMFHQVASSVAEVEVQLAADAAALAGAAELRDSNVDADRAIAAAISVATGNTVSGRPAMLEPSDVQVDAVEGRVSVQAKGRALPFDVPFVRFEVSAKAAAEARETTFDRPDILPKTLQLVE